MGTRRKSRELALKLLFQLDFNKENQEPAIEDFWFNHPCAPSTREFADTLVTGTLAHLKDIDQLLDKHAQHWSLDRMATIDRNILRFSAYAILYMKEIPASVSINEALEIAKKYSNPDAGKFINGILDRIAKEL